MNWIIQNRLNQLNSQKASQLKLKKNQRTGVKQLNKS